MRNPFRAARSITLAALAALATATCTDQPTEPGAGYAARVRFAPTFVAGNSAAGLPIDNVTVTVVRPTAETLLVRNAPFALDDSVLQLDLAVDLLAPSEELSVTLELRSGVTSLFRGTDQILVTSDAGGTTPSIPLAYVGPGASIAWVSIDPRDSVLSFGDTLTFGATAYDSLEAGVQDFYLSWSTGSPTVVIRADGRIIAPNVRAKVWIHAVTPTGIEDSTAITFTPVPTQLTKSGGDLQGAPAGDTLALPITVQVLASDDLPVQGVAVTFAAAIGGGAVLDTVVITDSLGHAGTPVVLGTGLGANSFTATVAGLTPVTFTATAGAGAPAAIAKLFGDAQSDTAGQTLPTPLQVQVTDMNGNPVNGIPVLWTTVVGGGSPAEDTVYTVDSGYAVVSYTLGGPGVETIRAQIGGTGAFVDFTATAVAGAIQVVAVAGDSQAATVATTLPDSLVVETQSLGSGVPVGGVEVIWTVQGGNGILSADTVVSDSLGRAAVVLTLGTVAGEVEVLVDAHRSGPLGVFHLQAEADAPHHLAYLVTPPDTLVAGALVTPAPVIEVRDSFGNAAPVAGIQINAYTDGMIAASPPQVSAPAGLQFSAYLEGGVTVATDSTGRATFDSLVIGGSVGDETLRFEENDLGLGQISTPIYLKAGAPSSVLGILGDAQTAFVDSLVVVAPRVIVTDSFGNVLEGIAVDWVVAGGGGQVTGASTVTDSLGEAEVGSWRMGSTPGSNALRAIVAGVDSAVFHATAIPLTPTIQLSLLGTNVVGVGRTASLQVKLSSPADTALTVDVVSLATAVVDVIPPSVSFAAGDSVGTTVLSGNSTGTADIVASAAGYEPDTLQVTGSLNLITLPTTSNVAFGQTASLPVQLALPAPAGGVVVNVTSLDPSKVSVVTPTVTFNAGEQLKNATVSGVALGSAAVVAENPNFAPDTSLVSTTATLNITAASLTAFSTFGAQITTEFRSSGALTPAPAGGITVTFTPRNPACVAAPATTLIPQGQTSKADSIGYGGSASLPCTTYLVATAPGIDPDSVQVTINPPPAATLNFTTAEVASGLQYGSYNVNLAVSAHGGRNVTVRTLDPSKVRIQLNSATAGTDSVVQFLPNTQTSISFWLAGMEGIVNDSALVVTTVPGFAPDTGKVYVRQGVYELTSVPASVNFLAGNSNIWVQMGVPNAAFTTINAYQGPRVGGTLGRVATVTLSSSTVAQLVDSSATPDSVKSVTFPVGQYYTPTALPTGLQIDPIGVGTVTATASVPGLIALPIASRTMTVNPAILSVSTTAEVGSGLQYGTYSLTLSGPNHGGTTVKLKVAQSGVGLVQPDASTAGTDSIDLFIPNGQTSANFWVAGMEGILNDTVPVVATAPGFIPDTMQLFVRQPAIEITNVPGSIGSLAANQAIWAQIGVPNAAVTTMNAYQGPRVGGTMLRTPTVIIAPGDYALLRDSTATPDSMKSVTIPIGQYYSPTSVASGGLAIDPSTPGTATVSVALAGFAPLPTAIRTMTVTGPTLSLPATAEVGSGLQYGSYTASLSASAHGGVTLKLKSLTPGVAVLQPDNATAGSDSLMVAIPNGTASYSFWLGGLEGITSDSALVVAEIAGFLPDTMKVYVRRPVFELSSVPGTTTTLSPNTNIWVQMGVPNAAFTTINAYQGSRVGGTAPTFYVRSNAPTTVRIVNSATFDDSLAVTLPAGQYYSPTTVATGGLAVDPLTTGSTQIVATHPVFLGLSSATQAITVATPGISVGGGIVGSGLQRQQSFTLGAPQHGGVDVVVKSTAPGVLKVSPDANTPGTDSIIVHVNNGNTGGNFYVQGMEGQTGAPTIQVSAPGFTDGSAGETVVQPAIEVTQVPTSPSSGAANTAIWAQVGVANGVYTSMNEYQNLRAGGADSLVVTFTNSNGAAAQLSTLALTANSVTAAIILGRYYTPTTFAGGGVHFDPLAPGSTTVTVSLAGFVPLPAATVNVNVGP